MTDRAVYLAQYMSDPAHVERARERAREWYANNTERAKKNAKEWQKNNPDRHKVYKRGIRYGITEEEVEAMYEAQNGLCLICLKPEENLKLSIDHDHDTGKVRGLLCRLCNAALGCFRDDPERMLRAVIYLGEAA